MAVCISESFILFNLTRAGIDALILKESMNQCIQLLLIRLDTLMKAASILKNQYCGVYMKELAHTYRTELNIVHRANTGMQCIPEEIVFHGHTVFVQIQTHFVIKSLQEKDYDAEIENYACGEFNKLFPTQLVLAKNLKTEFSKPLVGKDDKAAAAIFERLNCECMVLSFPVASLSAVAEDVAAWVAAEFSSTRKDLNLENVDIQGFFIVALETSEETASATTSMNDRN